MNTTTCLITLAVGTLVALLASWRFSRSGSHPRFRPAIGLVLMVFIAIMGVVGFLAVLFGMMVGNKIPPVMTLEERKVWEAQQKSLVPRITTEPVLPLVAPATESALPFPTSELPAAEEELPAPAAEPALPIDEPRATSEELPEPAPALPEPSTAEPSTAEPSTAEPSTAEPSTAEP